MTEKLNLRRNQSRFVLAGVLIILLAALMLMNPGRSWGDIIFAPLFIVGGVMCICYIDRLLIDKEAGILLHQRGIVVPLKTKQYSLKNVRAVRIQQKTEHSGESERTAFPVQLSGIKDATLLNHRNPWYSRKIAEQLAKLLSVPFVNRVYGTKSTRGPDELDLPLVTRWLEEGRTFAKPALTFNTVLQEEWDQFSYTLWVQAEYPKLKYLVILLLLLPFPAVVNVPFVEFFHSAGYRVFAAFCLVAGIMCMAFIGRSKFSITPTHVTFRQGYFPVPARLRIDQVEELIVASDGISLVGDSAAVWVHWGGGEQESAYLQAAIPYQLLRLGRQAILNVGSAKEGRH